MQEIQEYLQWKATHRKEVTAKRYEIWIRRFYSVSKCNIAKATFSDVLKFHKLLLEYSPKTQEFAMAILHDYVSYYSKRRKLKLILDDIRVQRGRSHSHKPITPEEYITMMTWVYPTNITKLRDLCLIRLLYDTGARISEICTLTYDIIDTEARTAEIQNAKRRDDGYIFWGNDTNEFLKTYLDNVKGNLFPSVRQCQRILQKYVNKAGIEKRITPHSFRHSKAWRILDNGGTVKDVQAILRHKSPMSSFKYLDWHQAKNQERAQQFM